MTENETKSEYKTIIIALIVIIGFGILASLIGFGSGMMGGGMMGGMMGFGWLFMLFPIILIIFFIYGLTDGNTDHPYQPPYQVGESPIEVLERRYASGEISRGEYLRIKEDIKRR